MEKKILDIGCGYNKEKGAIGIDKFIDSDADVICNVDDAPFPFKDSQFEGVICKQVIEHIKDPCAFMNEIYRVAAPAASVLIQTPHFSCFYAYGDPEHKRSLSYFSIDKLALKGKFEIVKRRITFHRALRRWGIAWFANRFPRMYERFWTFIFPAEHLHFELKVVK